MFGDALRKLTDQARHLYSDRNRYWLSTQPSVTSVVQDRARSQTDDDVMMEIEGRLRDERDRGDFAGIHTAPEGGGDVPDQPETRFVVLSPEHPHAARSADKSAALIAAKVILQQRGSGPRLYGNALVFGAADQARLADLKEAVRYYLAWTSIDDDKEELNLDQHNLKQVLTKTKQFDKTVAQRMRETYQWVLVPSQPDPKKEVIWEEVRVQGDEPFAIKASRKLLSDEMLITAYAGTSLRHELDAIPLWQGDSISVRALAELFAQYVYLPRLKDQSVFLGAVQSGVSSLTWNPDTFAYAEAWDEKAGRYLGLTAGQGVNVILDSNSLLVKPHTAAKQIGDDKKVDSTHGDGSDGTDGDGGDGDGGDGDGGASPILLRRFHGSVALDPVRAIKDISEIVENVVQHLVAEGDVELHLEVQADIPQGASDSTVRTVNENAAVLKFDQFGFEED